MKKKKKSSGDDNTNSFRRTLSTYYDFSDDKLKIIDFMTTISKNIFNTSIFCCSIFDKYKEDIYKELYYYITTTEETKSLQIIDDKLLTIFEKYYNKYCNTKDQLRTYNNFIYIYIMNEIVNKGIIIINDNFDLIKDNVNKCLSKFKDLIYNSSADEELFFPIVHNILRSIYMKNYHKTQQELKLNNRELITIQDERFINQVEEGKCLFSENDKSNYKKLIQEYINEEPIKGIIICNSKEYIKNEDNYGYIRKLSLDDLLKSSFVQKILKNAKSSKKCESEDINAENFFESEVVKNLCARQNENKIKNGGETVKLKADQTYIQRFIYKHLHSDENKLSSDLTIGIIKKAYESYISFYGLKKKGIKCNRAKYLKKNDKFNLMFYAHHCATIKNEKENSTADTIRLTLGSYIAKNYITITGNTNLVCIKSNKKFYNYKTTNGQIIEGNYLNLHLPKKLTGNKLNLIEIIPIYEGHRYKINYAYTMTRERQIEIKNDNVDFYKDYISVDLGTTNLMAIYDPNGEQYLIKGYYILHLNESYNYHIAKLQSALAKSQGGLTSKRIRNMLINRSNRINDYFNKIVRWFVNNYSHKKKIIIGYNINWKNGVNLGRNNNRKFYKIPYTRLLNKLKDVMELLGIQVVINEESYTSKCDALAKESIEKHAEYLGERIERGLFSSSVGKLLNADINGAINIMRKYTKNKEKKEIHNITGNNLCNPKKVKHDDIIRKGRVMVM